MDADITSQAPYRCRLEWGRDGAARAAARGDAVVIVDVLRFSSAVAAATARGAIVYPIAYEGDAPALAASIGGVAAERGRNHPRREGPSLSPRSYAGIAAGTRVVLPSLNGAECSVAAATAPRVWAGALVTATAVADAVDAWLSGSGGSVSIVACGERWAEAGADGALRFAVEDYLGAGAILARLAHDCSPEAGVCRAAYAGSEARVRTLLHDCASGRELRAMGLDEDIGDCARIDAFDVAPLLLAEPAGPCFAGDGRRQ